MMAIALFEVCDEMFLSKAELLVVCHDDSNSRPYDHSC